MKTCRLGGCGGQKGRGQKERTTEEDIVHYNSLRSNRFLLWFGGRKRQAALSQWTGRLLTLDNEMTHFILFLPWLPDNSDMYLMCSYKNPLLQIYVIITLVNMSPRKCQTRASSDRLAQGMQQPSKLLFPFTSSLKRWPKIQVIE